LVGSTRGGEPRGWPFIGESSLLSGNSNGGGLGGKDPGGVVKEKKGEMCDSALWNEGSGAAGFTVLGGGVLL